MNKKIASEFAIGLILLLAIVIGGIFWLRNVKEMAALDNELRQAQVSQKDEALVQALKDSRQKAGVENTGNSNSCDAHYFEGVDQFSAWLVSAENDGIVIAIKKSDASKFPTINYQIDEKTNSFNVKLIDPTDKVTAAVKAASAKKPATITLQGYGEVCGQLPLVSLEPATIAFKK